MMGTEKVDGPHLEEQVEVEVEEEKELLLLQQKMLKVEHGLGQKVLKVKLQQVEEGLGWKVLKVEFLRHVQQVEEGLGQAQGPPPEQFQLDYSFPADHQHSNWTETELFQHS